MLVTMPQTQPQAQPAPKKPRKAKQAAENIARRGEALQRQKVNHRSCRREQLAEIPLEQIERNPRQPRTEFQTAELQRLAASLKTDDLQTRVVVRPLGIDRYELIQGERRFRAAQLAGWRTIPASVRHVSDRDALEMMGLECFLSVELSALEKARYLQALVDEGWAVSDLAARFSHSPAWASNLIRLLHLPQEWKERLERGEITARAARAVLSILDQPEALEDVAAQVDNKAPMPAVERLIRQHAGGEEKHERQNVAKPNARELKKLLQPFLGSAEALQTILQFVERALRSISA